jgi:uncharacterized membrane protein YeaQ/YmgE (transglycosylase-associated protein family)
VTRRSDATCRDRGTGFASKGQHERVRIVGPEIILQGGTIVGIIAWLLVGLIAGWLAGMVMGGRGYGILGNIVVGVIGALLGGFVGGALFGWDVSGFNLGSIVVAFLGAVLFLLILRAIPGSQPFER